MFETIPLQPDPRDHQSPLVHDTCIKSHINSRPRATSNNYSNFQISSSVAPCELQDKQTSLKLTTPTSLHAHRKQSHGMTAVSAVAGGYIVDPNVPPTVKDNDYLCTGHGTPMTEYDHLTPFSLSNLTTNSGVIGGKVYATRGVVNAVSSFTREITPGMNDDAIRCVSDSVNNSQASSFNVPFYFDPSVHSGPGHDVVEHPWDIHTFREQSRAGTSNTVISSNYCDTVQAIKRRRSTEKKARDKLSLGFAEIKTILEENGRFVKSRADMLHEMANLYRKLDA